MKEEIKEIIKSHGGKDFFNELNAARIPFFFVAAVENTKETTEYLCETITPNTMGIHLTDDKFADFLDIRNHGFVTVPSCDVTSLSVQGLKLFQEAGRLPFYDDEALMKFAEEQGIQIEDGGTLDDEETEPGVFGKGASRSIVESVIRHVIGGQEELAAEEAERIPVPVCHCETLDISWGGNENPDRSYADEFARIDKRHQEILKGDGSFLQAKEQEAVYYNIEQRQPGGDGPGISRTEETAEETEPEEETGNPGQVTGNMVGEPDPDPHADRNVQE